MRGSFFAQLFVISTLIFFTLSPLGALPVLAEHRAAQRSALDSDQSDSRGQVELTFADMHMTSPQALPGPVSEYSLRFNLPVGWVPAGTVGLDLELSAFFSSLVPAENTAPISGLVGGNLSVSLNGSLLGMRTLQQSGDQTIQLEFDSALLTAPARGSFNELRLRWDGTSSCLMNLLTSVTILPTSKMRFSYAEQPNVLSLNRFPVPFIIEHAVQPVALTLLLPDSPALSEMRAALIVAAGIGQLSRGTSPFELVSQAEYHPQSTDKQNVILIATSEKLASPELQALGVTSRIQAGQGEGIIHLFQPPTAGAGLLVSGDESGIIKAAQAVSANVVIASGDTTTMVVNAVHPPTSSVGKEDMTLQDLGVGDMVLTPQRGLVQSFDFFIPAGEQARPDSSFNLIISHSQQLDYLRSGLQLKLNGFPTLSLRLNDNTSNQALFQLIMPSNLIHAGRNTVELSAELNTRDLCSQPDETVAWLRVSANSLLHLPLESAVAGQAATKAFNDFPDSFLSGSSLDNVTFVLPPADFGSWQAASKLAYLLGKALPQSQLLQLRLTWSNAVDPALTQGANIILVGRPLDFKTLSDKDQFPSLVFAPDNTLSGKSTLEVVSQPAAGADVGYLAIRGFVTETNRTLMAALGNSSAGINLAVDAVSNPEVRSANFAVVVAKGVQASWLDQGISTGEAVPSSALATQVPNRANAAQQYKQGILPWVLPAIAALLILLIFLSYTELRHQIARDS